MGDIKINSTLGSTLGVCMETTPYIPGPKRDVDMIKVRGRNGAIVKKYAYEDIEFEVVLNLLERTGFRDKIRALKKWVYDATRLEFTSDPGYYYVIQDAWVDDIENELEVWGKFTVHFTAKPFQYKDLPNLTGSAGTVSIVNSGTQPMPLKIKLTTTTPQSVTISIPGKSAVVGPFDASDTVLIVDGNNLKTTNAAGLGRNYKYNRDYIILPEGTTALTISGTNVSYEIYRTEAYL